MSPRTLRWVLFLGAVFAFPLPAVGIQTAFVPVGRQLMLAGISGIFLVTEGTSGVGPLFLGLFLGQAVLWSAVLWLVAWGISRVLATARAGFRQRVALVLVAILVGIGSLDRIYVTPYSAERERSTLFEVYR